TWSASSSRRGATWCTTARASGARTRGTGRLAAAAGRVLPGRRALELDDPRRERRAAATDVHAAAGSPDQRDRVAEARAGGPGWLRGVLPLRGQRRDAQAGRRGAR